MGRAARRRPASCHEGRFATTFQEGREVPGSRTSARKQEVAMGKAWFSRITRGAIMGLLLTAAPALAENGVIEINAARAVAGGVTPLDTPGFPITLSQPGSYRLTGNLVQPDPNTDVIVIQANAVTLDLGGFAITGSVTCSGVPTACVPAFAGGRAIQDAGGFTRTTVRNGEITGTGQGMVLGQGCHVEGVRISETSTVPLSCSGGAAVVREVQVVRTGGTGIALTGGVVERSAATLNSGNGIQLTGAGTVQGCVADANGSGIVLSAPGAVADSTASNNVLDGINASSGSTITGATVSNNGQDGIDGGSGVTVTGCTATTNGSDGFELSSDSTLGGSTARNNTGFGLLAGNNVGFGEDVFNGNNGGAEAQVSVPGGTSILEIGTNVCQGDTSCP